MQALGLIETKGLLAAVECADAMLKSANVTLIEKTLVGGGLVAIAVTGDVGAVKAAVEAGAAAVEQLNSTLLVSKHVIPRPHEELDDLIGSVQTVENVKIRSSESFKVVKLEEAAAEDTVVEAECEDIMAEQVGEAADKASAAEAYRKVSLKMDLEEINKNKIDYIVLEYGLDIADELLGSLKVTKLRTLAREYKSLGIAGRLISKADKKTLLAELNEYYQKTTKI